MKHQIKTTLLFAPAIFLALFLSGTLYSASAETIKWDSYENGVSKAKLQKKKIFLHFYADWCKYCKIMDQKTFVSGPVVDYLNKNFIAIRVNSDKEKKLASQYKVRGVPANWFISEDNEVIGNRPGYITPEDMIVFLKFINTENYKTMSLEKFKDKQRDL